MVGKQVRRMLSKKVDNPIIRPWIEKRTKKKTKNINHGSFNIYISPNYRVCDNRITSIPDYGIISHTGYISEPSI